jgi:hypothetical protein
MQKLFEKFAYLDKNYKTVDAKFRFLFLFLVHFCFGIAFFPVHLDPFGDGIKHNLFLFDYFIPHKTFAQLHRKNKLFEIVLKLANSRL